MTERLRPRAAWNRTALSIVAALFVVLGLTATGLTAGAVAGAATGNAVQVPPPSGTSGTTIDPLQYNCGNDAPTCGQVGESYGYYNGHNVDLLYSENYYCDTNVTSTATTGCEAGAGPSATPEHNIGRRHDAGQHHTQGHPLHPGAPVLEPTGDAMHGHSHLYRSPPDDRPVADRRRAAR